MSATDREIRNIYMQGIQRCCLELFPGLHRYKCLIMLLIIVSNHIYIVTLSNFLYMCQLILEYASQDRKISGSTILNLSVKRLSLKLYINRHEWNNHFILTLILCIVNWDSVSVVCSVDVFICLTYFIVAEEYRERVFWRAICIGEF